jgi:hypothetical protein
MANVEMSFTGITETTLSLSLTEVVPLMKGIEGDFVF